MAPRQLLVSAVLAAHLEGKVVKPSKPIMGFSTWNGFHENINETLILEVADALAKSGLRDLGYTYVNLDDVWAAPERVDGKLAAHPGNFPSGMKDLGDKLHTQGFHFGLYTARYNRTCAGKMPGSLGFEDVDAETFAEFGADFLKNDDCRVVYADAVKDYGAMQRALAKVSRPIIHNVKAPDLPAEKAVEICQFRRVGKDLKNSWGDVVRTLDLGLDDAYASLVGAKNGFFQDFDMLEVGSSDTNPQGAPKLTLEEQRSHFSLWAALKSPLVLGNDPRHMTKETLEILSNAEVIAVNQDELATPVSLVASSINSNTPLEGAKATLRSCQEDDSSQLWIRDGNRIRSAANQSLCLGLWDCQTRWPWWLSLQACADSNGPADSACSRGDQQSWAFNLSSQDVQWTPSAAVGSCWGSPGQGCCMSTEGGNPELDACGWPSDKSQQQWQWVKAGSNDNTHQQLVSKRRGMCLTAGQDLEVYAGPLSGGKATAILLNRSPAPANMTLRLTDVPGDMGSVVELRDLWRHESLGTVADSFTATVASHAVLHLLLTPSPVTAIV